LAGGKSTSHGSERLDTFVIGQFHCHLSVVIFHLSFATDDEPLPLTQLSSAVENDKWQMENGKWKMS
jgi:hypothetical protein